MIGPDFFLDRFGIFLSALFLLVGFFSFVYALATIRIKGHRLEYYIMLILIVGSGCGVALSSNLLLIFILWEISTFAIWRAVAFYRKDSDIYAANFSFILNFAAASIMLIGLLMVYIDNGTFNIFRITVISDHAAVLILIGILAKSVSIPMHVWLVPAYNAIPSAIGGCLAGVAENLGLILFFRLFTTGSHLSPAFFNFCAWLAIASSILGGTAALLANNLRNLLAFSTISQVGFIFLGFAVGGTHGIVGGMLYILAHALAKSGLFYGVCTIEDATGTNDLTVVSGMIRTSPTLGVSMALLVGSIIGFFPMIGFFSKLLVIVGAVERMVLLGVGAIVAAVFTLMYNVRFYHEIFFGQKPVQIKKPNVVGVGLVVVLALISLVLGILFYEPLYFLMAGGH